MAVGKREREGGESGVASEDCKELREGRGGKGCVKVCVKEKEYDKQ